jgi:6-phosphogluconolactonase
MKKMLPLGLLISCLLLGGVSLNAQTEYIVYAGSYTNTTSKGIYAWRFDTKQPALTPIGLVAEAVFPAQIWVSPNERFLYAANWQGNETTPGDTLTAYAIDRKTAGLTFLNKVSAGGSGPNQVVIDPTGRVAVAVNYRSGSVAAFGIEPDGRLTEAFYIDQHTGQPTPPSRQPGPRAHGVAFSKDGRYAYVADIGLDRVYSYRLDPTKRMMTPLDPPYVTVKSGSGPRRVQWHPNGKFLYVNGETDSSANVFQIRNGALTPIETISSLPADYKGNNSTAEILIDKAGKFLYISNRGHDTIAVYGIDGATGRLTLVEHAHAGGRTPRNFSIDPTGAYLLTSNQNGENIVVFRLDRKTGRLSPTGVEVTLANPGSVAFVKRQ